jgi:SNF2 family DNA or RNA helicase
VKYRWRTKPYQHQIRAVKKALRLGSHIALLMEPRTGKTKTTVDWLSILAMQRKIDKVLIICPNKVMDVWVEEFHTHSPCLVNVHVWDRKARRGLQPLPQTNGRFDLQVVVMNYEAFAVHGRRLQSGRRSKTTGRYKIRQLIRKWASTGMPAACVLDESHKIKSPSGKASNMIVTLNRDFPYRSLLTGTPVTKAKRIHDLWMQWQFLNPSRFEEVGIYSAQDLKEFTGVWTNRNGYVQWLRGKTDNITAVQRLIHRDAFAVKREDCFDLPPRETQIIKVPLQKSAAVYDKLAAEMVAELIHRKEEHTVEASIPLVLGLRLAQITSGFAKTDEGRLLRVGSEKLDALRELLEDYAEKDQKVVVAARFKPDLNAISRLACSLDLPVFELRGGMKNEHTTRNIRDFRRLDGCGVFVMQPQAGSLGIDLSTAPNMVWYSLTRSWTDFTQSNDRIALSRHSTTFTYLLGEGTVDEEMYLVLQLDGDIGKRILDKPERALRSVGGRYSVKQLLEQTAELKAS